MMRRACAFGFQVVTWAVLLVLVTVLVAAVLVPRVSGATPYAVLTGSMEPTHPVGSLVVVRPTPAEDLRVGDVITFQLESGKPLVATHRIAEITFDLNGDRLVRTKGDANDAVDPDPVREVQIKGRVWYSVPYVGHLNRWIGDSTRQVVLVAVVAALLLYAAYMFTSAARDRRRSRAGAPSGPATQPTETGTKTRAETRTESRDEETVP